MRAQPSVPKSNEAKERPQECSRQLREQREREEREQRNLTNCAKLELIHSAVLPALFKEKKSQIRKIKAKLYERKNA